MTVVSTFVGLLWRRLRRDRLALGFTFGLPVAVAVVMVGLYTADYASVGVVAAADDPLGEAVVDELEAAGLVDVTRYDDRAALDRAVRRRDVVAGVVVPRGALDDRSSAEIALVGAPGVETPSGVRSVVEIAIAQTAATYQVGRAAASDADTAATLRAGADLLADAPLQRFDPTTADDRRSVAASEALAGALILFVFTNTLGGASSLVEMRDLGVLARIRTTPASVAAVTVGYGAAFASYAFVQVALMLGTGWLLFGVTWASWPAVLVVAGLASLSAAVLTVLVATFLPSADMGTTVAGPVGFLLGMLGGCVWPLEFVGPTLAGLARLTPQGWAMEAMTSAGVAGDGLAAVGLPLLVLGAGTVAVAALGGFRLVRYSRHA